MLEPGTRLVHVRHGFAYETPKARSVIHFAQMRNLMSGDVVEDIVRRENQAPGIGNRARRRTGTPTGALIAHADPLRSTAEIGGMVEGAPCQIGFGLGAEPVE